MRYFSCFRMANLASILARLFVAGAFFAGSWQAGAQTPTTSQGVTQLSQAPVLSGNFGGPSRQTPLQVLNGTATLTSHYDPSQKLRLAVVLAVPHPAEEQQFLEDVQNRQSPLFHEFLSAEEWNARFGPSVENEQAVVDWAQSQGLTVTHRYDNRLVVDMEAQAGVIEKALSLTINHYQLPAANGLEARTVYSNDHDPILPESLSGVVDAVLGLNSIEAARPGGGSGRLVPRPDYVPGPVVQAGDSKQGDALTKDAAAATDGTSSAPQVTPPSNKYYQPSDFFGSAFYDYRALMNQGHCCNPLKNASGHSPRESSIAIASFGDVSLTDVSDFQQAFPYLAYYVDKIFIDGTYTCDNAPGNPDDNCVEVTMDTEWSLSMANSEGAASDTARVVVYEGSTYSNAVIMDVYNQMLNDAHARTMSTSWGWEENSQFSSDPEGDTYFATMNSVDKIFSSMVGQGWTLVAASGDNGATAGCNGALAVQFPSSDPNVVGAGGTSLNFGSGSGYEVAWTGGTGPNACVTNHGGSTGGFSVYWPSPGFQSGMGFGSRAVPDLALDSVHGHDVYLNGGWGYYGGTSVSAPMLAGFFAQANAYLLSVGSICGSKGTSACAPMGNANYPIYEEARRKNAGRDPFYDTLTGCNSNDITLDYHLTAYCAGPGYDEVTGWGSANMLQLAWAINWEVIPASGVPYITFSGPPTNKWYNTNQTVSWTIHDYVPAGGTPGTGIAGETQGWDSIPAEPSSEPHGGSGNLFYSGPQFPNGAEGCLAFEPNGCSGGASQGCHTVHARGWNNQGLNTAGQPGFPETYGPLCYDTVAPTVSIAKSPSANSAGWNNSSVKVILSANDPGGSAASGIRATYYGLDEGSCSTSSLSSCQVYSGPFIVSQQRYNIGNYFTEDNAGNFSPTQLFGVNIDETPPVTTSTLSGTLKGSAYDTTVDVTLKATDNLSGVASTTYSLDRSVRTTYDGPIAVSTPGTHSLSYYSTDLAGNVENAHTISFKIVSPTATTVLSSSNPSVYGHSVTFTATVTGSLGPTPTGTVTFLDGTTTLGTATLTSGTATLATATLKDGTHSITVSYSGSVTDLASKSGTLTQAVKSTTTTALASSLNPSTFDAAVTFTAKVTSTSGTPSGTVSFKNGSTLLGSGILSSGKATFVTSGLAVGVHPITAEYTGSTDYLTSTSLELSQTVNKEGSSVTLASSVNPSVSGEDVTFTATVKAAASGTPSGTVTFRNGTATLGTATISAGKAAFTTSTLAVGVHSITAEYNGSVDYLTSTSSALSQTVNK